MATVLDYLRDLVALTGPSGAEEDVAQAIVRLVRPLADTVEMDAMGNVVAIRQGMSGGRRCVLAAHMDEVGFRIRRLEPDGFLRFEKVGGTDNRVLLGQRVWVRGTHGRLLGVIGTRSAHLLRDADRTSVPAHTEQYIDIGARSADDAVRMGVRVGDPAGFMGDLRELGLHSGRYTAHALDDRAGCAILLALLEALHGESLPVTLVLLFTVQEEVGLRGAQLAAAHYHGDVGLAVDTTALDDTPDTGTFNLRLGQGPAIKVMDASLLVHPAVLRGLLAAGERAGISAQQEVLMGIGTDAGALQFGRGGMAAGTLSLGTRYTHSPVEVLDQQDLEGAVELLCHFVRAVAEMELRFTILEDQ